MLYSTSLEQIDTAAVVKVCDGDSVEEQRTCQNVSRFVKILRQRLKGDEKVCTQVKHLHPLQVDTDPIAFFLFCCGD